MPMRRSSGSRKAETISVDIRDFGWDAALVAVLDHSSLPWYQSTGDAISATPLSSCQGIAPRDALSLLGQFAAHVALLRGATASDVAFDASAWAVARERGRDARLVRLHGRGTPTDDPTSSIESFATLVDVKGLETLAQSWVKPEAVYVEIARRLRSDAAADLTWFRRASAGRIRCPGVDALRGILRERAVMKFVDDPTPALVRLTGLAGHRLVIFGDAACSPLRRGSALAGFEPEIGSVASRGEGDVAEAIEDALEGKDAIFVVTNPEQFDGFSRDVVTIMFSSGCGGSWFVDASSPLADDATGTAPADRWFFVSQRLAPRRELEAAVEPLPQESRGRWAETFVAGDDWESFVLDGVLPAAESSPGIAGLREPRRSYLAATALAGEGVAEGAAEAILAQLDCKLPLDEIAAPPFASIEEGRVTFAGVAVRQQLVELLPQATRAAIAHIAAPVLIAAGDPVQAARALVDAGEYDAAAAILHERITWSDAAALEDFPAAFIRSSSHIAALVAEQLIRGGRLADARDLAAEAAPDDAAYLLARIERRRGNYAAAAGHLASIAAPHTRALLLQAELLRLDGMWDDARKHLEAARYAADDEELARIAYELALIDLDGEGRASVTPGQLATAHYLERRYAAYVALANASYEAAIEASQAAVAAASNAEEKIDALLDLVYARFMAGQWLEARHDGVAALAVIEETQGDRAAGAILLTLGYLAADAGQWTRAENIAGRLRRFYRDAGDATRARDVDLLTAQTALGRGQFRDAHRIASNLLGSKLLPTVREGAALVADECDWIEGRLAILRSSGTSGCRELDDRHRFLNTVLTGHGAESVREPFGRALATWALDRLAGRSGEPPLPASDHERLRLIRALVAIGRRRSDPVLLARATEMARDAGVDPGTAVEGRRTDSREAALLRKLATSPFPFEPDALGDVSWRFASRNRLGQWTESGSLPPVGGDGCEALLRDVAPDVEPCGPAAFVQIADFSEWSPESRAAIAAQFRIRQEHHNLKRAVEQEAANVRDAAPRGDGIVGESPAVRALHERIASAARSDVAACILGESGTGKELIARAIHRGSSRRSRPFNAVNCAALPENLIESELFGHVRGAFTGADRDRLGVIESSDGGTLFLDEIGEMALAAQAKLLRFLQEGEFRRVGESSNRTADVRIVAATNRKLEQAVDEGKFREDLFYRIAGIEIAVPPLRDRGSDILLLAGFFLEEERKKLRSAPLRFSPDVEAVFLSHRWPGNVRELQNAVRAACAIAGDAREIDLEHLPDRLRNVLVVRTQTGTYYEEVVRFRRSLIETSLSEAKGNQSQAAKSLGMSRQALAYQIRELGIMVKG